MRAILIWNEEGGREAKVSNDLRIMLVTHNYKIIDKYEIIHMLSCKSLLI